MLIDRFELKAFGRFTNAILRFGSDLGKLHIVYGANESGKSTSLRGITAWLFGIDNRSTDAYLHAYTDLRVGGKLVSETLGALECVRRKGNKNTLKTIDESANADERKLVRMLGGMDQETFLRGFGLDRQRLIDGGRDIMCGGGELGQILFSAGVGIRNLHEIVLNLEQEKRAIFLGGGQNPELNKVLSDLKKLRSELVSNSLTATDLERRGKQLEEAKNTAKELGRYRLELEQKSARAEAFSKAMPLAAQRSALMEQMHDLGPVPLIDENFKQRRRTAETDKRVAQEQLQASTNRLKNLEQQIASLSRNPTILELGVQIRTCADAVAVYQAGLETLPKLNVQAETMKEAYTELLRRLGKSEETDVRQLIPSDSVRLRIGDLVESHARLELALEANQQAMKQVEQQLNGLNDAELTVPPVEPSKLAAVLKAYANPQRLEDDLAKATAESKRLDEKTKLAFGRLSGFGGTLEQAKQIVLPLHSEVKSLGDQYLDARQSVTQKTEKMQQIAESLRELETRIEQLDRESSVPTEEQLQAARADRDRLLSNAHTALLQGPASVNESSLLLQSLANGIRQTDEMVDAMRTAMEIVARRQQAQGERARLENRLHSVMDEKEKAVQIFESIERLWKHMWDACMVSAADPPAMQQWLNFYDVFCEAVQQHTSVNVTREQLTLQISNAEQAIYAALQACGDVQSVAGIEENLLVLHARAQHVFETLQTEFTKGVEAQRERVRLLRDLENLRRDEEKLQTQMRAWQSDWEQVVAALTDEPHVTPARLRQVVATIDAAIEKSRNLTEYQRQIVEIEQQGIRLQKMLEQVSQSAGFHAEQATPVTKRLGQLQRSVDEAASAEKQFQTLSQQIDECQQDIENFRLKFQQANAELEVLCREVACQSPDQLPEMERRSTVRKELTQELQQVESSLRILSNGMEVDSFVQLVLASDLTELQSDKEHSFNELQWSQARWEEAQQKVGALQTAYDEMDGSGKAAEINQEIQALEAKAAKLARRYALLAIQQSVLNRSIDAYRDQNQGPILQRATEYFSKITCGRYQALRPYLDDKNQRILVGVRKSGERETEVRANLMSEGTADALFLSLRLAGLEAHVKEHGPIPLVMDDVLVQFDDQRCAAALDVLSQVSLQTQVIFFTHHQHLVDLVSQTLPSDCFVVHNLEEVG